jgi:hypothetical protein
VQHWDKSSPPVSSYRTCQKRYDVKPVEIRILGV